MKKLDTSAISVGIGMPVKSGTLVHLQAAYIEAIAATIKAAIGPLYDPAKYYVMYGCIATGTDPGARTISAGAVFFNGEIYLVDAVSPTTTGVQVLVGKATITYFTDATADPVQFTDGTNRSVHQIRKIVFSNGASGSGDVDFDDMITITSDIAMNNQNPALTISIGTGSGGTNQVNYLIKNGLLHVWFDLSCTITPSTTGAIGQAQVYFHLPFPLSSRFTSCFGSCFWLKSATTPLSYAGVIQITGGAPDFFNVTASGLPAGSGAYSINGYLAVPIN